VDYHYLDHNATSPVHPEAAEAMAGMIRDQAGRAAAFGNPSSLHAAGREARRRVEDARESLARLVGAAPQEIVFTSGGTEANNLALLGFAAAAETGKSPRRHIVASSFEHSSVLEALRSLEARGWAVTRVDPDGEGVVRPEAVAAALRPDTALATVMAANNEVGTVQPVAEIGALLASRGIPFHCDAVQALGKLEMAHPAAWQASTAAFSAHKINGPKGIGALYARKGAALKRLQHGGPHERGLRGGTENVPGIVGFGKAAEVWTREGAAERVRLAALRDGLEAALRERIPDLVVNGAGAARVPNTLHVTLPGCASDLLVMALDMRGVAVSAGSACASGASRSSHVVLAMGKGKDAASSSLRLSLGRGNTAAEIPAVADAIAEAAGQIRA
jgi:cysteine desulfurase